MCTKVYTPSEPSMGAQAHTRRFNKKTYGPTQTLAFAVLVLVVSWPRLIVVLAVIVVVLALGRAGSQ